MVSEILARVSFFFEMHYDYEHIGKEKSKKKKKESRKALTDSVEEIPTLGGLAGSWQTTNAHWLKIKCHILRTNFLTFAEYFRPVILNILLVWSGHGTPWSLKPVRIKSSAENKVPLTPLTQRVIDPCNFPVFNYFEKNNWCACAPPWANLNLGNTW